MAIKQKASCRAGSGTRTETTITFTGETHHFDLTVEPLRNAFGVVIGVTCAAADVTAAETGGGGKGAAHRRATERRWPGRNY